MKGYRIAWFLLGILIALVVVPAFGATIADYPEADIWTALDAPKSQKIWNQPGNLVAKAMVQPRERYVVLTRRERITTRRTIQSGLSHFHR